MNIRNWKEKIKKNRFSPQIRNLYQTFSSFRPKKYFSQVGEDIILDYLLQGKEKGFYVDVGAYHPIYISNTYKFYKKGWTGIQIEPNYKKSNLFKKYRPYSVNLNIGIGKEEAERDLFIFNPDAYSTFSPETAEINKKLGHKLLEVKKVSMMPLRNVFAKYAPNTNIDLLSVDTEGYDLEVLRTNNWTIYRPNFVLVETMEPDEGIFGKKLNDIYDQYMKELNYTKVADTYLNTIYMDSNLLNKK